MREIKRTGEVLVQGPNPLTQAMVDQVGAFFEWILEVKLTEEGHTLLRDYLIGTWTRNDKAVMQGTQTYISTLNMVNKADQATRDYRRDTNQPKLIQAMRTSQGGLDKYLLQLYEAAHPPLAPGYPPLTQKIADAFTEVINFMNAVIRGMQPEPLSKEVKDALEQQLVAAYQYLPVGHRTWLTNMPFLWATIHAAWPHASEADKAELKQVYMQNIGPLLDEIKRSMVQPQGEVPSDPVPSLLQEIMAADRKEEERAKAISPQAALEVQFLHDQQNAEMFSNMMRMSHETNMAIIRNMGPYKRW